MAKLAVATLLAVVGPSAVAAGTWNLGNCGEQAASAATFGNTLKCTAPTTVTGAATTTGVTISAWGATGTATAGYQAAYVGNYGSIGVSSQKDGINASSPQHALDNDPSSFVPDLLVLKFDTAVILDKVTLGWWANDNDITVMAYTGPMTTAAGAAITASDIVKGKLGNNATGGLTAGVTNGAGTGWGLVQNVGDGLPDVAANTSGIAQTVNYSVNGGGVSSSFWLISAYNAGFGGSGTLDSGYAAVLDYVKLFSVATRDATTTKVPEPGSLALVTLAILGGWSVRRRSRAV